MNKEWHLKNMMPKNPTNQQRTMWHQEYQKKCSCRPIPEKLAEEIKERGIKYNPKETLKSD